MRFYGIWETWKVIYTPLKVASGMGGVALVEAGDRVHTMQVSREQYKGRYFTVESIKKLSDCK